MLDAFFFIIGGIQPKVRVLDERPVRCPACGLHQATTRRIDHYLSLFFIPLIRVKTGEPFLACERCLRNVPLPGADGPQPPRGEAGYCRSCGRQLPAEYRFCPHCGRRL
jgi:RNA polymerase subunit RPABC4/transcription elongation factor Spt4